MKPDKKNLLLSTAYLPPIEYFSQLIKSEHVFIEQYETYPKQTYRNRCTILSGNGKLSLSVPVQKVNGNQTRTKDVRLFKEEKWQVKHWRAIQAAYSASPFFLYYTDELEGIFFEHYENLLDFNLALTLKLCRLIGFQVDISLTTSFEKNNQNLIDLRQVISPKHPATIDYFPPYIQVFSDRFGFVPNLSIVDLLFNLGPETGDYLKKL